MSLVRILILSNVLDPTVSLRELIDAFRSVDELENDDADDPWSEPLDVTDAFVRSMTMLP